MAMANPSDNQACSFFATIFAQLLARVLSSASGAEWQIRLAEPPSATLPMLKSPVNYCLRFGKRLKGACYVVFSQADLGLFAGKSTPAGEDPGAVEDPAQVEASAATLLELMRTLAAAIPQSLAESHGAVTTVAEKVEVRDPAATFALELQVKSGADTNAIILLHFDPPLLKSLAASALNAAAGGAPDKAALQANLGLVMDVELNCTLRFGQRQLPLRDILDLASGSVVELDRQVDEPVELILDGRVIARGEAVIIDGNYGLRITQVLHSVAF
jgi:flagellar motor switch protein FliN/FliY